MSVSTDLEGKFFLDTNIFVYSLDPDSPAKSQRATELIRQALLMRKGVVSYQVVQEFFNVATIKFTPALNAFELHQYLKTVFVPLLGVHSSPSLFSDALNLKDKHKLSWYDSLIVASAIQAQCSFLLTEDLQHGRKFGSLQIKNPFL